MNILTFDIEDWYNCDFISENLDWRKFEYRIDKTLFPILDELDKKKIKGTFFCLGWLAEHHPDIIREIHIRGHQIGCHSYQHELSFRFTPKQFKDDTYKAKSLIENVINKEVEVFRAPGFSITEHNTWAIDYLVELGFRYDCSVFPAFHDYGGMPNYGLSAPTILKTQLGNTIKEFPVNIHTISGKHIVFSGGGFFRFFPYWLIKKWCNESNYIMTYFHPRDFDKNQPIMKNLPLNRRIKSYIGISGAFNKFQKLLDDFEFINIESADKTIDWNKARIINL